MRAIRMAILVVVLSALSGLLAQAAEADEAAAIYDPAAVVFIDLTLSPTEKAKLEANPDKYVEGTFSLAKSSDGTPAGEESTPLIAPRPAEIRLKGNVGGSFRDLSGKAAFKLKFKKTEPMLGLRKMTLNNMVQDPSMLHETLAYAAFRAAGVPAPRTGYAYVRLNGKDLGVYMDLETLDETALTQIFGGFDKATQHLYEGEDGHDVKPGEAEEFEVDEGEEGPGKIGDLEALIAAVNAEPGEGESWSQQVAPNADLAEMTKMWAVEKYIDHWDGYSGHTDATQAGERPNNYYLYSEPTGRFQMLPWGTDQAWVRTIGVGTAGREVTFDGPGGVLFNKCLEDDQCFRAYWRAVRDVRVAIGNLNPTVLAEDSADLLAPWQKEEIEDGRPEYNAEEIKESDTGVDATLEFIAGRSAEAYAWLASNIPSGELIEPGKTEGKPGGTVPPPPPPKSPSPGSLAVHGFAVDHGVLTARLSFSAPGGVSENVSMHTKKGRRRVCSIPNKSVALAVNLRCQLSKAAKRRLSEGRLRLRVVLGFAPQDGGAAAVLTRTITAQKESGA
jgi:hypothetical protein